MNRIEIIIKNDPNASQGRQDVVYPTKRKKRLGRRRSQALMNFWDLGMVSTGPGADDWEMLDFQPSACPFGTSSQAFDTTYHEELLDKLFEVPVDQWASHYKRIVPAMDYGLEIMSMHPTLGYTSFSYLLDSSNPDFTNAGLRVSADFFDDGKCLGVNLTGNLVQYVRTSFLQKGASSVSSGVKVTSVYDPSASEVSFQPKKSVKVFLVPALPYALCRFEHAVSGVAYYTQQLNEFWYLLDRGSILTPSHPIYGIGTTVNFRNPTNPGNQTQYDTFLAAADYFKTFTNSRARYSTTLPISYTSSDDGSDFGNVLPGTYSYSSPPTQGTVHMASSLDGNTSNLNLAGATDNQMLLRAVAYQDGTYYYIWNYENV